MTESVRVFLSAVSGEFGDYRDQLRSKLTRHNVEVKIQEDFKDFGSTTLEKLDDYIKLCGAVVHLVGDMTGAAAGEFTTKAILARYADLPKKFPPLGEALAKGEPISYTQWEAWLALYHGKVLLIAKADDAAPRGPAFAKTDASRAAQNDHLQRLRAAGRYPGNTFTGLDDLTSEIFSTPILELLAKALADERLAQPPPQPKNLPFATLGTLFKGRELFLEKLHTTLSRQGTGEAATATALHGLGGVGKTRAAIEYALRHTPNYSALLFVAAETPDSLHANLAKLAAVLHVAEEAREDEVKIAAVLQWLEHHPLWLLILDNADDESAAAAVEALLPSFFSGRVLITSRLTNFSAAVEMLPVDVLGIEDATAFLLERTKGQRAATPEDAALARELAQKLGGLALGLEQAGAYIAKLKIGFTRYLGLWQESQAKVLGWFDPRLMAYHHSLATTWAASVEQVTPAGRRLLDRLSFFAPEPVPESLLGVAAPGDEMDFDAYEALADLFAYSLVSRVEGTDGRVTGPAFTIHRLVQEFTRTKLDPAKSNEVLADALGWVNEGFPGGGMAVDRWPVLDPLAPHALILAKRADDADIPEPTTRLMSELGILFHAKSKYAEAEPMYRRALAIDEARLGPDHPNVAIRLRKLASFLQVTNRLAEAEQMYWRALAIDEARLGPDHPNVAAHLRKLPLLLQHTNRLAEAEPIAEARCSVYNVASYLYDLAVLLHAMKRLPEPEPLLRRAVAIAAEASGLKDRAVSLDKLPKLLSATNLVPEAEHLMRRALASAEAHLRPDDPNLGIYLNNLAQLLHATNRLAEAEPMYRRALAIDEKSFGPDHLNVASRFRNLALLLQDTNRLAEAEPLLRRALAIFAQSLGWEHSSTRTVLANLMELLRAVGRSEAEIRAAIESLIRAHGQKK